MKRYRIASVEPLEYPTLRVTFEDGLCGVLDLSEKIENGPVFAPLKDEIYFRTVAVGEDGHTFGWNLGDRRGDGRPVRSDAGGRRMMEFTPPQPCIDDLGSTCCEPMQVGGGDRDLCAA